MKSLEQFLVVVLNLNERLCLRDGMGWDLKKNLVHTN